MDRALGRPNITNQTYSIVSRLKGFLMSDRITLVAGGGGFIGGHLVRYLQEKGHKQIRVVDVKPMDDWYQVHSGVENVIADLDHREACLAACRGVGEVYNLAAD